MNIYWFTSFLIISTPTVVRFLLELAVVGILAIRLMSRKTLVSDWDWDCEI